MCSPATCPSCHKATWRGCGNHVEMALAGVPAEQRCSCNAVAVQPASPWFGSRR